MRACKTDGKQVLTQADNDRTRGNVFKLQEGRFRSGLSSDCKYVFYNLLKKYNNVKYFSVFCDVCIHVLFNFKSQ